MLCNAVTLYVLQQYDKKEDEGLWSHPAEMSATCLLHCSHGAYIDRCFPVIHSQGLVNVFLYTLSNRQFRLRCPRSRPQTLPL